MKQDEQTACAWSKLWVLYGSFSFFTLRSKRKEFFHLVLFLSTFGITLTTELTWRHHRFSPQQDIFTSKSAPLFIETLDVSQNLSPHFIDLHLNFVLGFLQKNSWAICKTLFSYILFSYLVGSLSKSGLHNFWSFSSHTAPQSSFHTSKLHHKLY